MGSTAFAAAVPYPGKATRISRKGRRSIKTNYTILTELLSAELSLFPNKSNLIRYGCMCECMVRSLNRKKYDMYRVPPYPHPTPQQTNNKQNKNKQTNKQNKNKIRRRRRKKEKKKKKKATIIMFCKV